MKRTKLFDNGGMDSSGPTSAFSQQSNPYPSASGGLGNYAPLVQIGDMQSQQPSTPGLNLGQPQQQQAQPAMKRGGKVKMKANCYAEGGSVKGWGKARGGRKAKIV